MFGLRKRAPAAVRTADSARASGIDALSEQSETSLSEGSSPSPSHFSLEPMAVSPSPEEAMLATDGSLAAVLFFL